MSWRDIVKKDKEIFEKEGSKPDYIDIDGDGNKTESMKEAAKDKKGRKRGSLVPKDKKGGRSAFTSKD